MATVTSNPSFNAEEASTALRKAMKGMGCDKKAVCKVLVECSNAQRQEILRAFKTAYGRDLESDLKSELGGHLEDAVLAMMKKPSDYDAWSLKQAFKGAGTDEADVAEILASRSNEEIAAIRESYSRLYKKELEDAIISETGGHLKRIFISLVQGNRPEGGAVDADRAARDARALFEAGEKAWGTDESEFNRVFLTSGKEQLQLVDVEYQKISQYTLRRAVEKEMSGNLEMAFVTVLECALNTPRFFAERAYRSMKGMGTADADLIRVCVSRSEIDMVDVKREFQTLYGKTLMKMIKGDTSGVYESLLLALIGEHQF